MPYSLDLLPGTERYQAMIRSEFDEAILVMHNTCAEAIVASPSHFHHTALRRQFAAQAGESYALVASPVYTDDIATAPPCYICDRPVTGPDTPAPPDDTIRLGPVHLARLKRAASDDSWRPDFDGRDPLFELDVVYDLIDDGLLDKDYRITPAGRACLEEHERHAYCLYEIACGRGPELAPVIDARVRELWQAALRPVYGPHGGGSQRPRKRPTRRSLIGTAAPQ